MIDPQRLANRFPKLSTAERELFDFAAGNLVSQDHMIIAKAVIRGFRAVRRARELQDAEQVQPSRVCCET